MKKITLISGEESGDKYGAMLVRALKERIPDAQFTGMGGDEMRKAGVHLINDINELSVVGFFEVLSHFGAVLRGFRKLKRHLSGEKQDLLILIDFPDFNIRMAHYAKTLGMKILYFISPQVWAWRKERVKTIARLVDKMIVIFPFEVGFYDNCGVKAHFVGHPLMDIISVSQEKHEVRKRIGVPEGNRLIGILPGSRNSEVKRILPAMLGAARLLSRDYRDVSFVIPAAKNLESGMVQKLVQKFRDASLFITHGDYYEVANSLDLAVVASGTATVELALLGKPMVVVYRLNPLSYLLARSLVKIEHVAMVNLIAGKRIVPELIQGDCNERKIYKNVKVYLDDEKIREDVKGELGRMREKLGEKGMFRRAAEIVLTVL